MLSFLPANRLAVHAGDIDMCVFLQPEMEPGWFVKANEALCRLSSHAASTAPVVADSAGDPESTGAAPHSGKKQSQPKVSAVHTECSVVWYAGSVSLASKLVFVSVSAEEEERAAVLFPSVFCFRGATRPLHVSPHAWMVFLAVSV